VLPTPPHIRTSSIGSPTLQFPWDERQVRQYYWTVETHQFERLDALTNEANLALSLAVGEWVFHRFASVNTDSVPLQFLEAAWASMVHPAYCIYTETDNDQWRGPVRGPLAAAITIANDAIFCLRDDPHVATRVCWMCNLARHVLPATGEFDVWFDACVLRLERYHSKLTEKRPAGRTGLFDDPLIFTRPVPREACDPQQPYDPIQMTTLIDRFLTRLQPASNSFLRAAAELATVDDLPGPPYRYLP
jgi:hypothetical protein